MKVNTKAFGELEVDDKQKVSIPLGLFGFENYIEYVLIDSGNQPFFWLQSVDEKEIAFIMIDPFLFRKDYEANVTNEELAEIGIKTPENVLVFVIVTIPQDGGSMTANLQGPLIINKENMRGMQAILSDAKWKTKHDIMSELKGQG
jgi:flagellar assembly factor FliW